jgi:hypothetical protein
VLAVVVEYILEPELDQLIVSDRGISEEPDHQRIAFVPGGILQAPDLLPAQDLWQLLGPLRQLSIGLDALAFFVGS